MKKIYIIGKNPEAVEKLKIKIEELEFIYSEENPDLVVSYGGDGMFLISERIFPCIPKLLIRESEVGNCCHNINITDALKKYNEGNYEVNEIKKLKATCQGQFEIREIVGINDIVIRNSLPTEAIRFRYKINQNEWSKTLIGDGMVISTSYGSTKGAYFYSIEQKSFENGIGVAFNNTTEKQKALYLNEKDLIEIEIIRGIGVLVSDNNRDFINLEKGDKIKIKLTDEIARRIVLNNHNKI